MKLLDALKVYEAFLDVFLENAFDQKKAPKAFLY